jgi:hypothetical protein
VGGYFDVRILEVLDFTYRKKIFRLLEKTTSGIRSVPVLRCGADAHEEGNKSDSRDAVFFNSLKVLDGG